MPAHQLSTRARAKPAASGNQIAISLALVLGFALITLNLAFRLPFMPGELLSLRADNAILKAMAQIGEQAVGAAQGQRLIFALSCLGAALLGGFLAKSVVSAPVCVPLAFVWIMCAPVFGIGALQIGTGAVLGGLLTVMFLGLVRGGVSGGVVATAGLSAAVQVDASMIWAVVGLGSGALLAPPMRAFRIRVGFWLMLMVTVGSALASGVTVPLPLEAAVALAHGQVPSGWPPVVAVAVSALPLGCVFFAVLPGGKRIGEPYRMLSCAVLFVSALLGLAALLEARLTLFQAAIPPIGAVVAAGTIAGKGRLKNWAAETATPLSFLLFLVMAMMLLHPNAVLTTQVPVVRDLFGWDRVAHQVEFLALRNDAQWIATERALDARSLTQFTTLPVMPETALRSGICASTGIYLVGLDTRDAVAGKFRSFTHLSDIPRAAGSNLEVYLVSGATPVLGCPSAQSGVASGG